MKTLYILRHAKSSWALPGLSDKDRPLNARGQDQCALLTDWFKAREVRPQLVLCSGAVRTRETLERISDGLPGVAVEYQDALYHGTTDDYLDALYAQDADSIMIVGHNPTCDELTRYLTSPSSPMAEKIMAHHFGTGSLAILEFGSGPWTSIRQAGGKLTEFLRPRDLESV